MAPRITDHFSGRFEPWWRGSESYQEICRRARNEYSPKHTLNAPIGAYKRLQTEMKPQTRGQSQDGT
jgi:hypothetical protein